MTVIAIKYNTGFRSKRLNEFHCEVPGRPSAFNQDQWLAYVGKLTNMLDDSQLTSKFYHLQNRIVKRLNDIHLYQLTRMIPDVDDLAPVDHFYIPEILHYHAPGNKLKGLTFGEFIYIENYYNDVTSEGVLEKLLISIYRTHSNNQRDMFDDKRIDELALSVSSVDPLIKLAVYYNWMAIREWLGKTFSYLFEKKAGTDNSQTSLWIPVFERSVVGDDLLNRDKYSRLPAIMVLKWLNTKMKEAYKNGY